MVCPSTRRRSSCRHASPLVCPSTPRRSSCHHASSLVWSPRLTARLAATPHCSSGRHASPALVQFVDRLIEWPQYCNHILRISHLRAAHPDLYAFIERALNRISVAHGESDVFHNSTSDTYQGLIQSSASNLENAAHLMVAKLAGNLAHVTCNEPIHGSISVILRCISPDEAPLAAAQKAFKGLYENASNSALVDAHLVILAAIRDVSKLVVKELTSMVLYSEEDRKFNKDITIGLICSELLSLAEYNVHMAKFLDCRRNKAATGFAISLVKHWLSFVNDSKVITLYL
ncbi:hypothetical protein ACS0TY_033367 [Phlomoides rotata]